MSKKSDTLAFPNENTKKVKYLKMPDNIERTNIGYLSNSQLKQRLKNPCESKNDNKSRNGKEGINKVNNFKNILDIPRKRCFKCRNHNNLALHFKVVTFIKLETRTPMYLEKDVDVTV